MKYLICYDNGENDIHTFNDMVEAKSVLDAISGWYGSEFDYRIISVQPISKDFAAVLDDPFCKAHAADEWLKANDRRRDLASSVAQAVGSWESR